jgi:hypothetical protein
VAPAAYALSIAGICFGFKAMLKHEKGAVIPISIGIIELILFIAIPVFAQ